MPVVTSVNVVDKNGNEIPELTYKLLGNKINIYYGYFNKENIIKNATVTLSGENFAEDFTHTFDAKPHIFYNVKIASVSGKNYDYQIEFLPGANNIPVISLYTENGAKIQNRLDYVNGTLYVDADNTEEFFGKNTIGETLKIRGRGNASWDQTDKKAFRIKLDSKASILGLKSNRDWVLVSNHFDKSLLRNVVALNMAKQMDAMPYTPTQIMVDFFLNGEYMGVYGFGDKIEEAKSKVNLESEKSTGEGYETKEIGFLIEEGWDYSTDNVYGKDYFDTKLLLRLFIKEPKITEWANKDFQYVRAYIEKAEAAVVAGEGYENYIDIDAMVDWFIIAELTNNTEMAFFRSTYFYKPADGKIIMGPVWDFDMAFGNHQGDISGYNGWATAEATYSMVGKNWMTYLVKYPEFMKKVAARWQEKKELLLKTAFDTIDAQYALVAPSAEKNFKKWNILQKQIGIGNVNYNKYSTHELQVEYLKEFLTMRANYIDNRLGEYYEAD